MTDRLKKTGQRCFQPWAKLGATDSYNHPQFQLRKLIESEVRISAIQPLDCFEHK